jgi:hypothetical protein
MPGRRVNRKQPAKCMEHRMDLASARALPTGSKRTDPKLGQRSD